MMSEIFYRKKEKNYFNNFTIDVKKLYENHPVNKKINPKKNQIYFMNNFFNKIYRNRLIPLKIRSYLWYYFRQTNLDLSWFNEFNKYWIKILGVRSLKNVQDLFFLRNLYNMKFQGNIVPDTNNQNIHLEAWQRPELIHYLLYNVTNERLYNEHLILKLLKKKKKRFRSFLEFGCGTAPITTALFEFFRLPKNIKIYISDIQTLAFHYAAYKFRGCSNVIPILLNPKKDFLLDLNDNVDVIFCITVFEHLNKPLETIKIFHKLLNYNGILFFDYVKNPIDISDGMDTQHGIRERNEVLDFIMDNFKVVFGKIKKEKSVGLTIVKKH
jgi:SAM-dependent methyltransferase